MSKYIDAEKLIAEIERRKKELFTIGGDTFENRWACGALDNIKEFIASLQQEQEQHVIGGQVFGATDVEQLYEGKVYIVSNLVQDTEFGLSVRDKVKMLLIKD